MVIINLFGAPGAGKSSGAAYIFAKLKMIGYNAELITEFAKDKVWEDNSTALNNQAYLFGKQYYRISRCQDKVDVVVTDSPLLLCAFYNDSKLLGEPFEEMIWRVHDSYVSYNAFIERAKPYNPVGRLQTETESDSMSFYMLDFMCKNGVDCTRYAGNEEGYRDLLNAVVRFLGSSNNK